MNLKVKNLDHECQAVIKLVGGLGNQLFQYFFALSLSKSMGCKIFFDTSFFKTSKRPHEKERLSELGLTWIQFSENQIKFPIVYQNRFLKRIPLPRKFKYIRDNNYLDYEMTILESHNLYFDGFWQSYKYFQSFADDVSRYLNFALDPYLPQDFSADSFLGPTVSVHIRRGDYLISKNHAALGVSYYDQAIDEQIERIKHPTFIVFSDDITWVKENINFKGWNVIYASQFSGGNDLVELSIMRMCKHHIIANSTFSWWGAWISWCKDRGNVIAPKIWLGGASCSNDLFPLEWRVI